ncbi:MAG: phosphate ABC transporter ATP-binding protein PstB [Candidatus Bathyarchaeia archaeon]
MEVKIQCKDLSVYFGNHKVLKEVNLSIGKNSITAIIGPSGCGKSTLIKSLNRMNDIVPNCKTTGEILLDNENVLSEDFDVVELRRRVGMVFQKPNPFPKTVYENVAYGPRIHGVKSKVEIDAIVEKSLKQAALWDEVSDRLQVSALELSGGQQQRLCIARALAVQPEVILMDEPCSALDPMATAKIEQLMVELKRDYTVVIVTHNMQQAARVADYVAFLYLGELVEFGPTRQVFERPVSQLTENYITGRFG